MAEYAKTAEFVPLPDNPTAEVEAELERLRNAKGSTRAVTIRERMQQTMTEHVSVFRTEEGISKAVETIRELKDQFHNDIVIDDRGQNLQL